MAKVLAISSAETSSKIVSYFGEGELLGDRVPDHPFFRTRGATNPCIQLDSGKLIWGFQCWWGNADKIRKKYENYEFKLVTDFDEVKEYNNITPKDDE